MERNFYNDDDFEQFLKQKADQYKMYPSDRVWNNIDNSIRGKRRWFMGGLFLLLLGTAALVTNEILSYNYKQLANELNQDVPASVPYFFTDDNSNSLIASNRSAIAVNRTSSNKNKAPLVAIPSYNAANLNDQTPGFISAPSLVSSSNEIGEFVVNSNTPENINKTEITIKDGGVPELSLDTKQPLQGKLSVESTSSEEEQQPSRSLWQDLLQREALLKGRSKLSLIMYASPIVSYRKLSNINKSSEFSPVAVNFSENIDGYVDHKPAIGFELGSKAQYNLSKNLLLQAGLQLNYSRYNIRAYNTYAEKATIALRSTPRADTFASYTSLRNFGGYSPEQLQNQYLQLSIPIGAELVLLGGKKRLQLSVAASVQPSYLLTNNSFLISTDYKNYVKNPDLTRRWNLHTNVEAFVSYKANGLRWQVGPQFRHQTLSSYSDKYPIREYITEFGFKLGVSKTIR